MPYKDLRAFIERLEQEGELRRVPVPVHWRYELGGWARLAYDQSPPGPALLFEAIRGYSSGFRVLVGALATPKRVALALELPPTLDRHSLVEAILYRCTTPLPPRLVEQGPVKEHCRIGEAARLTDFPAPWWYPRDGGRYIGTWHVIVSKDPRTGVRNVGTYRVQILDDHHAAVGFLPATHLGIHFAEAEARGEPLEVAIVIGADEAVVMAGGVGFPLGTDEYGMAGALRGGSLELIRCETVDLEVPANAEIVLEGRLLPRERRPEGPFGEHTGYHAGGVRMRPVFQLSAASFRNRPILRASLAGKPVTEEHLLGDLALSAVGVRFFETAGIPGVLSIHCPPAGSSYLATIIRIHPQYVGHARDVGRLWLSSPLAAVTKLVVVVDEDIDPTDFGQVWWALTTRVQPDRDLEVLPFGRASRSDPSVPRDRGEYTSRLLIDATRKLDTPYVKEWHGYWPPTCEVAPEILELVRAKWEQCLEGRPVDPAELAAREALLDREFAQRWEEFRAAHYNLTPEEQERERRRSYPSRDM